MSPTTRVTTPHDLATPTDHAPTDHAATPPDRPATPPDRPATPPDRPTATPDRAGAPDPEPLTGTLSVSAWPDAVIDQLGHDPRSAYVEQFWLGILGPSTTWLLRRLATGLESSPSGFVLPLAETARALGLGSPTGRHSPFVRSLHRACQFKLARWHGNELEVRRKLPPLSRGQVAKLPEAGQRAHHAWQEQELRTPTEQAKARQARRLALSLLELGEDLESTERWLLRWKYQPTVARTAAGWAWQRHREARAAATAPSGH